MKKAYLALTLIGLIVPYSFFVPWLFDHGLDVTLFFQDFFANKISGTFGLDVIISAIVLIGFILYEGKKLSMGRLWIPIIGTLLVGVSFGLPLFLYMREVINEKKRY